MAAVVCMSWFRPHSVGFVFESCRSAHAPLTAQTRLQHRKFRKGAGQGPGAGPGQFQANCSSSEPSTDHSWGASNGLPMTRTRSSPGSAGRTRFPRSRWRSRSAAPASRPDRCDQLVARRVRQADVDDRRAEVGPSVSISCSASAAVAATATRRPRSSNSVRMKKLTTVSSSTIRIVEAAADESCSSEPASAPAGGWPCSLRE